MLRKIFSGIAMMSLISCTAKSGTTIGGNSSEGAKKTNSSPENGGSAFTANSFLEYCNAKNKPKDIQKTIEAIRYFFNTQESCENINYGLNKYSSIKLGGNVSNLEPIRFFTHITEISITKFIGISEQLEVLSKFTKLRKIKIESTTRIENINFTKNLTDLEKITIEKGNIKNIQGIAELKYLRSFYFNNNMIEEIPELSKLESIKEINLANNRLKNISFLKGIVKLNYLNLNSNIIENFYPLIDIEFATNDVSLDIADNKAKTNNETTCPKKSKNSAVTIACNHFY